MGLTSLEDTIKGQLKLRQNAHFMLVDAMSKLIMAEKVKRCQSLDFQVSDLKWRLIIGQSEKVKDHLYVGLEITDEKCTGCNWDVKSNYKIGIVSQTGPEIFYLLPGHYYEHQRLEGKDNFISYKTLKESYLVNDKAVFYAEICYVEPTFPVTNIPRNSGGFLDPPLPRNMGTAERFKLIEFGRSNSRFTWKITQFSSFTGEEHSSYEFTVGPRRWRLVMFPKGNEEGKGNSLSLYLYASDYVTNGPKGRTLAVYKLKVLDQLYLNHYETECRYWFPYDPVHPKNCLWGRHKLLPLEELHKPSRGFLVNDEIYFNVEILIVSTTEYL